MNADVNTQMNLAEIQQTISELESALLNAHPEMPTLLRKIHTKLKSDPAIVTLLSEEEIAHVINGLKVQTNVSLISAKKPAAEKSDKKPSAASRLKALGLGAISADDF